MPQFAFHQCAVSKLNPCQSKHKCTTCNQDLCNSHVKRKTDLATVLFVATVGIVFTL